MNMKDRMDLEMDYRDVSTKRDTSTKGTLIMVALVAIVAIGIICLMHFGLGMSLMDILGNRG